MIKARTFGFTHFSDEKLIQVRELIVILVDHNIFIHFFVIPAGFLHKSEAFFEDSRDRGYPHVGPGILTEKVKLTGPLKDTDSPQYIVRQFLLFHGRQRQRRGIGISVGDLHKRLEIPEINRIL